MPSFGTILRRLLAQRNCLLTRIEPEIPPSVSTYLRDIRSRTVSLDSIFCFDNEISIQSEILQVFPEGRVFFSCPLFNPNSGTLAAGSVLPSAPSGSFVVVVDIEAFPLEGLLERLPWLRRADVLLLRSRLGSFWNGELDLCEFDSQLQSLEFYLADVPGLPRLSPVQAPGERAIFAYEPRVKAPFPSAHSRYRALQALAYLSAPIVQRRDFQLLAGRGSFGFAAGVFNPGAIVDGGHAYLLTQGDRTPWVFQKSDESRFFSSSQALLLMLGDDRRVSVAAEISTVGLPDPATRRIGDFRLFKFRDQVFTNHFVMSSPRPRVTKGRSLRIDELQTLVGISKVDVEKRQLAWCGFPGIDRPLARAEKNWAMFTDGGRLFLLYSFAPYVLLAASNWPGLDFTTILETRFTLPFDGDGLPLRNSVNPVEYDDAHWLHIVHKVYPGKQYSFWAVLIDKQSLQPVRATARPLVCGWRSHSASIIYTCSVIAGPAEIHLFSGLDDSATAVAKIPRSRLDAEWVAIQRDDRPHSPN